MKFLKIYNRQFFCIVLVLVCFMNEVHSQQIDTIKIIKEKPGFFVGFSLGPSQTNIKNTGTLAISNLTSSGKMSFMGSAEIGYFFTKNFGLSSGIEFVTYKSQLALDTYQSSFNTVDSENEAFEMRVTGSGIKEIQTVSMLSIPFCVNLRLPLGKKVGLFFKGGLNMAFPLSQKYTSSAVFTYTGYYPAYNILLGNLPAYGFPTDKNMAGSGNLILKAVGVNPVLSFGFDYQVKKKMKLVFGISYRNTGLKSNDGITPDKFQLTPDAGNINSFAGGCSNIGAQSLGFEVTLRYYMK